jgi:hypothetical protein
MGTACTGKVVVPASQRLMGNPEHGGEHMIDLF